MNSLTAALLLLAVLSMAGRHIHWNFCFLVSQSCSQFMDQSFPFSTDGAANETCRWMDAVRGMRNSGNEAATHKDASLDDCKELLEASSPTYKSLEYHTGNRICYLQKVDRFTHRLTVTDANYVYEEYSCERKYRSTCEGLWKPRLCSTYLS